jgi:hypothetical protein
VLVPPVPDEDPEAAWGPLAVIEETGGMDARTEGILRIDRECAYLDHGPQKTLLVWPEKRTRWVPPGGILLEQFNGDVLAIQNGQRVAFGGGHDQSTFEWVNPPDPRCPADHWLISEVAPLQ